MSWDEAMSNSEKTKLVAFSMSNHSECIITSQFTDSA